jgi:hypothetical protein
MLGLDGNNSVTPAKAGAKGQAADRWPWIPAFAGMTVQLEAIMLFKR